MKSVFKFLIALQIALSPALVLAQNTPPQSSLTNSQAHSGQPLILTDTQVIELPNGETYTSETNLVLAENPEEQNIAENWFKDQISQAQNQKTDLRVVGLTTEGAAEMAASSELISALTANSITATADLKISTQTIKKPLLERIKLAAKTAGDKIKQPFAKWVEKRPEQFNKVFALARGGLNGVFSSYVFNYYFLDGAIPTWLAWTAGLTMGTISGVINYFSGPYSHWLDRAADPETHNVLLKYLPFLNSDKINELKSLNKWALLEAIFLGIPIMFFEFLPGLLGLGDGYSFAPTWLAGLFAVSMSFATGMFAQYPWEKGITRAHTADAALAPDHLSKNWVEFRTALMFVIISALQVTVTSLSLGDHKVGSYLTLGAIGVAGMYYRNKTMKRTNKRAAEALLKELAPPASCKDLLSQPAA